MVAPGSRFLIALVCLFVPPSLAADWKPPTEKKALEKTIKDTIKEYDALSRNHDLIQTRRRRELILRLGTSKCCRNVPAYAAIPPGRRREGNPARFVSYRDG